MLQGHAIQKFHGDEDVTVLVVDFVDRANVRMIEGGGSARLAPETLQPLRILGRTVGQKLERHEASELSILSFVDDTHAPAAELLDDAVVRDGFANH